MRMCVRMEWGAHCTHAYDQSYAIEYLLYSLDGTNFILMRAYCNTYTCIYIIYCINISVRVSVPDAAVKNFYQLYLFACGFRRIRQSQARPMAMRRRCHGSIPSTNDPDGGRQGEMKPANSTTNIIHCRQFRFN